MFYLLPNMPPILENSAEDEVTIAMVEFEKKRSIQRYSRYGSTMPENKTESEKLANTLLKTGDISIAEDDREYDKLANKMVCAKRIQYAAGFITLISIIIVLILTTIKSGDSPSFKPHAPQHGHSSKSSPSDLGFDAATAIDTNQIESILIEDMTNSNKNIDNSIDNSDISINNKNDDVDSNRIDVDSIIAAIINGDDEEEVQPDNLDNDMINNNNNDDDDVDVINDKDDNGLEVDVDNNIQNEDER